MQECMLGCQSDVRWKTEEYITRRDECFPKSCEEMDSCLSDIFMTCTGENDVMATGSCEKLVECGLMGDVESCKDSLEIPNRVYKCYSIEAQEILVECFMELECNNTMLFDINDCLDSVE